MKPRNDNPKIYRENVYKSWKLMAYVVSHVDDECFVAHLEPNPGVGYDCLSLITRDTSGNLRVRFMLNRNGVNANVLDRVWECFDEDGCDEVAKKLMSASALTAAVSSTRSSASALCEDVVAWIEEHRNEDFCVGPIGWPGGCRTFLDVRHEVLTESDWPIPDHGPELCLGIGTIERIRIRHGSRLDKNVIKGDVMTTDKSGEIRKLALSIAMCDQMTIATSSSSHCCTKIATAQEYLGNEFRQSPEPWAGDLAAAPVLFIASNPSISEALTTGEDYPLVGYGESDVVHPEWDEERIVDFHLNRFDQVREFPYVTSGAQFLCRDGSFRGSDRSAPGKGSQTYWRNAFKETSYVLKRNIDISHDVCLTEVVHCKTKSETGKDNKPVGLSEALSTCAGRYLDRILSSSNASLIVISGKVARTAVVQPELWSPPSGIFWDLDRTRFGQLPKFKGLPSAHLGIAKINDRYAVVCAMRHLSNGYGCGSFIGALGAHGAESLAGLVGNIDKGLEDVPKSRADLLRRLGLDD
jgi:hypothetical protein